MTDAWHAWYRDARRVSDQVGWASGRVGEVGGESVPGVVLVDEGFRILLSLWPRVDATRYVLSLHAPIKPTRRFLRRPPGEAAAARYARWEPPSLYLLTLEHSARYLGFEEYKLPWSSALWPAPSGISSYYRIYRDPVSLANDWEYNRSFVWETDLSGS